MKGYSTEYGAAIAMFLSFLLQMLDISVATEELTNVVTLVISAISAVWLLYKRISRGGINVAGFRK